MRALSNHWSSWATSVQEEISSRCSVVTSSSAGVDDLEDVLGLGLDGTLLDEAFDEVAFPFHGGHHRLQSPTGCVGR